MYFWPVTIHRSLIYASILLCTACAKTASIPPTDLTLSSFGLGPNNLYTIIFTSNIDLLNAFNTYENANQLTPILTCSLDNDLDFSVDHSINVKAEGRVTSESKSKTNHTFLADLVFYHTNLDGTQLDLNSYDVIKPLIAAQASIPCKVRIAAYGYKAYYTNTLLIPSALMMDQMSQ
ncbi:hypothetical protein PSH97_10425 [Pseudomonas cucumis]|uniref:Uncharacterized protein n=1 Tax=Pseudomonas cucumis TaxID=2954082 RepID=A0ABY9F1V7_9PSED|nr:hypothetical protein [Pseudomonas cucumis]WLG86900.1 hypothetical protein PSH97_10425 [Pseudomonas cucumis]